MLCAAVIVVPHHFYFGSMNMDWKELAVMAVVALAVVIAGTALYDLVLSDAVTRAKSAPELSE